MTIGEFFLRLATDREFLARYNEDAEGVAREAGLSDAQRALLVSGDLRKLRVKINAEFEIDGEIVAYQTVHTVPITVHAAPPPSKD
jgi:hypothetical protein